jgi:acyl-coenzyme A thioesterase 9
LIYVRSLHRSDDRKLHSVKDHIVEKTPITAQLWQMRKQDNHHDSTDKATLIQTTALPRTTEQSRLSVRYNFNKDSNLRDLYVDHTGNVLVGKLFEDMDALAGNVANKHCCDDNPLTKRLSLVTASVDEILQRNPIPVQSDIILTGNFVC